MKTDGYGRQIIFSALLLLNWTVSEAQQVGAFTLPEKEALGLVASLCDRLSIDPEFRPAAVRDIDPGITAIEFRGATVGERFLYRFATGETLRIDLLASGGQPTRLVAETRRDERPQFFVGTDNSCTVRERRRLVYNNPDESAVAIALLDDRGGELGRELLNPMMPSITTVEDENPVAVRVALVDSGVNYLLPEIAAGLARDYRGAAVGYDFWDEDDRPFDAHTAASPFFVQRHGTRTASLLLRDAGERVSLVSYRYPRPDMTRMARLIAHADSLGVRVIGLPLGSNRATDWSGFENAAAARPHILFVVSAGNGGRDIDQQPVYPAALELDNMIVVSSANDFAGVAERVNWGNRSVDYLLPAERQPVLGFSGQEEFASGSSYAVARMVAMAARILRMSPSLDRQTLVAEIDSYLQPARSDDLVAKGYIADPRAPGQAVELDLMTDGAPSYGMNDKRTALDLVVLDPRWDGDLIDHALTEAADILDQCEIGLGPVNTFAFKGADYLRDLETGAASTLLAALSDQTAPDHTATNQTADGAVRIVFARDTRMAMQFEAEAFAPGNTRSRPWLSNSIWIAYGAPDLGITIAHELYHVLANDGRHLPGNDNLMAAETSAGSTALTKAQCARIR